jgi:hypothetical protein
MEIVCNALGSFDFIGPRMRRMRDVREYTASFAAGMPGHRKTLITAETGSLCSTLLLIPATMRT